VGKGVETGSIYEFRKALSLRAIKKIKFPISWTAPFAEEQERKKETPAVPPCERITIDPGQKDWKKSCLEPDLCDIRAYQPEKGDQEKWRSLCPFGGSATILKKSMI
jgi:hypothetical protein